MASEDLLIQTDALLTEIAADVEFGAAVESIGYDAARLAEGRALCDTALRLREERQAKEAAYQEQKKTFKKARKKAKKRFKKDLRLAKTVLEDLLELKDRLPVRASDSDSFENWYQHALAFYHTALNTPDILAALEKYGLSASRLQKGVGKVVDAHAARPPKKLAKAEKRAAFRAEEEALVELEQWIAALTSTLTATLKDDLARLRALGVERELAPDMPLEVETSDLEIVASEALPGS